MNSFRVVLPLVCGVFVYCVFSILLGPKSIWSFAQLASERDKILANLESIYAINADLDARVKNLTADPDTISMYAHEIGFVSEGERLIRLAGFSGGIDRKLSAGFPMSVEPPVFLPEWICKVFGISGAAACFFLQSLYKRRAEGFGIRLKGKSREEDARAQDGQGQADERQKEEESDALSDEMQADRLAQ